MEKNADKIVREFGKGKTMFDDASMWSNDKSKMVGYTAISTRFNTPLTLSIDRIRGLYANAGTNQYVSSTKPSNKEQEADDEILSSLRHLLAEKFLVYMLAFILDDCFDDTDRKNCQRVELSEEILRKFLSSSDVGYDELVTKIIKNFDNLLFKTDMVLVVPSVNYFMIREIFKKTKIPKRLWRFFSNSSDYYYELKDGVLGKNEKEEENLEIFLTLLGERSKDMAALSALYVPYSLGQRLPFIRLRNVPSQELHILASALSRYSRDMEARNKISDFVKGINDISDTIKSCIPDEIAKIMLINGKHIKVLSDLPVEWIKIKGLPLCIEKSFSRVPITPGNGLIAHANNMNRRHILDMKNIKVLIVNSLNPDDDLFIGGQKLNKVISGFFSIASQKNDYVEVTNKNEFIDAIESKQPDILIYYGHGVYDEAGQYGKLQIREDLVTALDIETIKWKPLIVLLGACETQVMHGSHLNVANLFLESGTVSVLGAYFPVDGGHAFSFICGLMRNLVNTHVGAAPEELINNWADIILMTFRSHYIMDSILSLDRYLKLRGIRLNDVAPDLLEEYYRYWECKKLSFIDQYRLRDEIYLKALEKYPDIKQAYESILANGLILPQSLFYSSLGSPEKIVVQKAEEAMTLEEVNKYYNAVVLLRKQGKRSRVVK